MQNYKAMIATNDLHNALMVGVGHTILKITINDNQVHCIRLRVQHTDTKGCHYWKEYEVPIIQQQLR